MITAAQAIGWAAAFCALSAGATATQAALADLSSSNRRRLSEGGRTDRQLLWLWGRRGSLLSALRTLRLIATLLIAALTCVAIYGWYPDLLPFTPILLLLPLLLLSEILPRVLAARFGLPILHLATWPLSALYACTAPARIPAQALRRALPGVFRGELAMDPSEPEEAIRLLLHHGAASGAVDPLERDLIEAVFDFDDLTVDRLMTPRPDIQAIPLDIDPGELLERCRAIPHSRIPVHSDRADQIVGILLQKDLLKHRRAPISGPRQLQSLLLPPVFVPASRAADAMLQEFLTRHIHMAFVVDEHGALLGLITLDDLLRVLVGDLDGETDSVEIDRISPEILTVKASIDLEEFIEETGIDLPTGDYRTLGGFILHQLGRLPKTGDRIPHGAVWLSVTAMEGRRVAEVAVHLPAGHTQEEAG